MRPARTPRWGLTFAVLLIGMLALQVRSVQAEDYSAVTPGPPGAATAALLDPYDPLPQIGCYQNCGCRPSCDGCFERRCCHDDCRCYPHCRPIRRDGDHDGDRDRDGGRPRQIIDVDCSRRNHDMAPSIDFALRHIAPNGTIRILPPGEGMTCVESLVISFPVTLESIGEGRGAVIQAPDGHPCISANIPLGDALKLHGLKFIARGREAPCVQVTAGIVEVADSDIDSRNTNWAFDVADSGALRIRNTRVQTDGSGVHAYRANVEISGLGIDMSPNRVLPALQLERTDGSVEKVEVIGGRWGVLASPGAHGLSLSDIDVVKANTGVELVAGAQGAVHATRLWLSRNRNGLVIGPYVTVEAEDNKILGSQDDGIVLFGADARIRDNTIKGGRIGIRVARADEFAWTEVPMRPLDDPPEPAAPEIVGNHVGYVREADVFADDQAFARIVRNVFAAPPHCTCIAGDRHGLSLDDNDCVAGPFDWDEVAEFGVRPSAHWGLWFEIGIPGLLEIGGGIGSP